MSNGESHKSGIVVPIIVALIGALASIAVAWITATQSAKPVAREAVGDELAVLVGTVIVSLVPPEKLAEISEDSRGLNPTKARWLPADGRDVLGSRYAEFIETSVPDLRGLFLRGLNRSEQGRVRSGEVAALDDATRKPGSPQSAAIQGHGHKYEIGAKEGDRYYDGAFSGVTGTGKYSWGRILEPTTIDEYGNVRIDVEPRPKNAAVFYDVRLN